MGLITVIVLSFLISSAWLHYLRKIDLFDTEKLLYVIITFILGAAISFVTYPLHYYVYQPLHFAENGKYLHDFLYDVIGIGAVEETLKFIPALVALLFMKKAVNEPIDYIKYTLVSALGFAFAENVSYCLNFGVNVLISRSILVVPAHMFFSSLFVYGIVLRRYRKSTHSVLVIPAYMLLSFIAHGLYDFTLDLESLTLGILVTVMYFFVLMSVFITMLNNGLNNSPFFNPKYVIDTDQLRNQMCLFYAVIVAAVIAAKIYFFSGDAGLTLFYQFVTTRLFIVVVLIFRLCRFKLIQHRWNPLKLELPFLIYRRVGSHKLFPYTLKIKGDGFNEIYMHVFFHEHFELAPLKKRRSMLKTAHEAYIESKFYLKNDETFFVVKVAMNDAKQPYQHYLLKARTMGPTRKSHNEPIAALLSIDDPKLLARKNINVNKFKFIEWVVLKKLKGT